MRILPPAIWMCLVVSAFPQPLTLTSALKGVEKRYNDTRTLQVLFTEEYRAPGRGRRLESGTLFLRKPGRMRWEYNEPKGKIFVGDGKHFYLYNPESAQVRKAGVKESADMHAPLAFLLGRLDFRRDFRQFQSRPEGQDLWITADPKSENLPYTKVEFQVTPSNEIRRVRVTGHDQSILDFTFSREVRNPTLGVHLFQFQPPPGVQVVEAGQ